VLSLIESSWSGSDEDTAGAALVENLEKLIPATLQRLKQEIVQEHLGYEQGEVSLRDAALVLHRTPRLSACAVATVSLQMCYVSGLGKDARPARGAGGRRQAVCDRRRWEISNE